MNVLFICTSNKDRSPALEKFFRDNYPQHEYRSAGINKYFCGKKGTHYVTQEDIEWADFPIFAEKCHLDILTRDFPIGILNGKPFRTLNLGEYSKGCIGEDYLVRAELTLKLNLEDSK